MKTLFLVLFLSFLPVAVSSDAIAKLCRTNAYGEVLCCCKTYSGGLCCASTTFCGSFVPGCFCSYE